MSYFEDILDAEDKLLTINGHKITNPHKDDAVKAFTTKIKAPKGNFKLDLGTDMVAGKDDGYDIK